MSVYGADESCYGHMDLQSSFDQSGLPVCPYHSSNEVNENYLTFSGTPGLNFTLEIAQVEDVKLGETSPFTLSSRDQVRVFKFVPTEDVSDTQLDVTVTSDSADVPAYLKVSRVCKEVDKDGIDEVDYKRESIRLSFAKKGRITLSKVSVPPLTNSTSSWFIGIAIKNATGKTPLDATKTVNLTLTRSFDYSYSGRLWFFALFFFLGFFVSCWAWCSFRKCLCCSRCTASKETQQLIRSEQSQDRVSWGEFKRAFKEVKFGRGPKTYSYITFIVGSVLMVGAFQFVFANWYVMIHEGDRDNCYYNDFCYRVRYFDIPYNLMLSNLAYVLHGIILVINVLFMEAELLARCKKRAAELNSSAQQNTTTEQNQNHENGEDKSKKKQAPELTAEDLKSKYTFTIGYAFGWALTFEGLFSSLYHLCPSKLTFQFDTAFMFVIASLIVVVLYNGIDQQDQSANVTAKNKETAAETPENEEAAAKTAKKQGAAAKTAKNLGAAAKTAKNQVEAANLFLYFLVPLLILNYLGTMHHTEAGLVMAIDILFFVLLGSWVVGMAWWAKCKAFPESNCSCKKEGSGNKPVTKGSEGHATVTIIVYCICVVVLVIFLILLVTKVLDFPETFLLSCIFETSLVVIGKLVATFCCVGNKDRPADENNKEKNGKKRSCFLCSKVVYVLATVCIGIVALVFFFCKQTTDKVKTPEKSRDLNQECFWMDFFDTHDVWHILSSFALLMSALLVLHASYVSVESHLRETSSQYTNGESYEMESTQM